MINKYFKLNKKDIAAVQFILEGYDNMVRVTTVDSSTAVIQVAIMEDFASDIAALLDRLKIDYHLQDVHHPAEIPF